MHSTLPKIMLVSIQLLAIMLLQGPMILPLVGKGFSFQHRGAVSSHDHQLCGCSPERIANHTCCCSKPAGLSRMAVDPGEEEGAKASCGDHEHRPKIHYSLKMMPCGATSPLFMSYVQDCMYLQYLGAIETPAYASILSFECPGSLRVRYCDPPDPPPKIILSV